MSQVGRRYLNEVRDKLDMLDGKGHHCHPANLCYGDGYFALSLERKWGYPLDELRDIVRRGDEVAILKFKRPDLYVRHT